MARQSRDPFNLWIWGGVITSGQRLTVADASTREDRLGEIPKPKFNTNGPIRVVVGPQDQHFAKGALKKFLSEKYRVTDAYDRMGMRVDGPMLALNGALSIPSEPIVRGSVQVSGDGVPTVLLADHQTTGGYPKIATVIACDTDRLSQLRSGNTVTFTSLSGHQVSEAARAYALLLHQYLQDISVPRGTLEQRLTRENLVTVWADDQP